jgi:hypothetical protein
MSFVRYLAILLLIAIVSACSGGSETGPASPGATDSPPSVPASLAVSYDVRNFVFAWDATASAAWYELMEDPDGPGAQTESQIGGSISATTYAHDVSLPARVNAQYRLRACNAAGCSAYTAAVAPDAVRAVGYFKASNPGSLDAFGQSVALSADGNTMAVGAYKEASGARGIDGNQTDDSVANSGAVYIFSRSAGRWSQQAYVKASNTGSDAWFGSSVALSADGNTLAVGAPQEASSATGIDGNQADNSAADSGAVYVFTRSSGTWSQQAYVKASNAEAYDFFGSFVALSADGNTLGVSAHMEDSGATGIDGNQSDNSASKSGAAYVFTRIAGAWNQQAYIKASNTGAGDLFGYTVALSADGNTMAVGAYGEAGNATGVNGNQADDSAPMSGAAYVFTRTAGIWSQQAYVKASNTEAGDMFGGYVALSADGSTLAVGSDEGSSATGINGNQADNSAQGSGAVYVFTRSAGSWSQQAYVKASNPEFFDIFGSAIALSADGNIMAVGATWEASSATGINGNQADNGAAASGAVYTYTRSNGTWSQQAYLKAPTTEVHGWFGMSLALSADGRTLAVGAQYGKTGSNTGIPDAGAVYIY